MLFLVCKVNLLQAVIEFIFVEFGNDGRCLRPVLVIFYGHFKPKATSQFVAAWMYIKRLTVKSDNIHFHRL